jgi:hypothetical protein
MRRLKPREFHEMHWNPENSRQGRLVEERSLDLSDASASSLRDESSKRPLTRDHGSSEGTPGSSRRRSLSDVIIQAYGKIRSHSRRTGATGLALVAGLQNTQMEPLVQNLREHNQQAQMSACEIPNASFARKFGLLADGHALPPSIKELPVAEQKAVNNAEDTELPGIRLSLGFQGPFTPQLWFDGGLDYRI